MERAAPSAAEELRALTLRHSEVFEKGFAVDLRRETARWHEAVRALGAKRAYALMSETLCARYAERFGREFLFSQDCVAFEIAYHAEAYFRTQGFSGHARHLTTLLFDRAALARHCEVIDVSVDDVSSFRQRLMFGYARGVRPCYRNTERDPFDRSAPLARLIGRRKK